MASYPWVKAADFGTSEDFESGLEHAHSIAGSLKREYKIHTGKSPDTPVEVGMEAFSHLYVTEMSNDGSVIMQDDVEWAIDYALEQPGTEHSRTFISKRVAAWATEVGWNRAETDVSTIESEWPNQEYLLVEDANLNLDNLGAEQNYEFILADIQLRQFIERNLEENSGDEYTDANLVLIQSRLDSQDWMAVVNRQT